MALDFGVGCFRRHVDGLAPPCVLNSSGEMQVKSFKSCNWLFERKYSNQEISKFLSRRGPIPPRLKQSHDFGGNGAEVEEDPTSKSECGC
eukprot:5374356-Amphidinium_carterae.2